MYSIVFHAHQKLDRIANRHLKQLLPAGSQFPHIRQVLHFEAGHGPDSAKMKRLKNGGQPWHFVDPLDTTDTELHQQIEHHYANLVQALKRKDEVRAAFEAAWLAHALVDGLTPAHHFPYEEELAKLRGENRNTRKGLLGRLYVKGDTLTKSVLRSLKLIGPKGLLTTHAMFEAGAYALILPFIKCKKAWPPPRDIDFVRSQGVVELFKRTAREVAELDLYRRFYEQGWTGELGRDVRRELAPRMVRMVTLAWYAACHEAQMEASQMKEVSQVLEAAQPV